MKITEVRIFARPDDTLKAFAAVVFDNVFVVHNLRIVPDTIHGGLMVCMPSRKKNNGEFADVAHPITNDFRMEIQNAVLKAYEQQQEAHGGETVPAFNQVVVRRSRAQSPSLR